MNGSYDTTQITAAVLAGGQGSRVAGANKGLMRLSGRPLVAHVVAAVEHQASARIICINRNNAEYAAFGDICTDSEPGFRGPLAAIAAALGYCKTTWLLTVPVDCPRPPLDLGARLYEAAYAAHCKLAVAHDGSRRQPLFALYRCELAASAAAALARDLPAWRWQDECRAVAADFADNPRAFANLNTPEDFRRWEQEQDA